MTADLLRVQTCAGPPFGSDAIDRPGGGWHVGVLGREVASVRLTLVAGLWAVLSGVALLVSGCTNDPYPSSDRGKRIVYSAFSEAPKTLDPAVAYTTAEHIVTGNVYDTLLEYHYLKRPYTLIPALAEAVPKAETLPNGHQSYRFRLRPGILFHDDPCFAPSQEGRLTRAVTAADIAFQFARLADPAVNSPVASTFADVLGFAAFGKRLVERRKADPAFAALPAHEQYKTAGGIQGVVVSGDRDIEFILATPNPQLLYWFAMPFTTPMAWEAVAYYDGKEGRPNLADRAVGTGPFRLALYEKQYRFVLERNDTWYGRAEEHFDKELGPGQIQHYRRLLNVDAPGTVFPTEIDKEDIAAGRIDPAYAGRRLPFLDRIVYTREKESIPRFNKFLQGYYDDSGIIKESFDAVIVEGALSPGMKARGIRLDKEVEPSVFYLGFNMDDKVVGAPAGDKGRKLRQAMSLAVDAQEYLRLFTNGRGLPAQSPLPPGLFGYDKDYKNPFRDPNIERAKALLAEAGYPSGSDPATGQPLKLSFDVGNTGAEALLQYEFLVGAWRQLGLDVQINATTYNQFQDKVRRGAYQIFQWGWIADFPDPENFLFLLICENKRSNNGGPNTAGFCNAEFDDLYRAMKVLPNEARRGELIARMLKILEIERPWIELFHREDYALRHAWMVNSKSMGISAPINKYEDVDPALRSRLQAEWNAPVRWPLYLVLLAIVAAVVPAVRTYYRERL
jgi:oligopeptide transport system substrate-binding protein